MDTLGFDVRLSCYVREEEGEWVAGCPALDVHTQADSKEEAQAALREAVDLWLESCLQRDTLPAAMRELGWRRLEGRPEKGEFFGVTVADGSDVPESVLGELFPIELSIPAYQAASLMGR